MFFKKSNIILILLIGLFNLPFDALGNSPEEATYSIRYPNQVTQLLNQINAATLWNNLEKLTSFPNRESNSNYGIQTESWIKTQIENMAKEYQRTDIAVYTIETPSPSDRTFYNKLSGEYQPLALLKQSSIILKIGNSTEPGIIIGAHMDTVGDTWDYKQLDDPSTSVMNFLLLPDDAKLADFSMRNTSSIRLQRRDSNIVAIWNKDTGNNNQIVTKVLMLDDLKRLHLEKIISLFPGKSEQPRQIVRAYDDKLMDSIASLCDFMHPVFDGGIFPGADDDGSGVVTLLEMARVLFASNTQFKKPIYLIWYAAEENGLLGSAEVVKNFKDKNISVAAIMQLDQTGYVFNNNPTIYLESGSYTDVSLTNYLQTLGTYYVKQPVKFFTQGGGGSDHENWFYAGYKKIVRPGEDYSHTPSNPYMHTPEDTIDKLSLNHMVDYLKLTIAFTTELAEPVS